MKRYIEKEFNKICKSFYKAGGAMIGKSALPLNSANPQMPPVKPPKDTVNHPSHYETGKFECIEVMIETQGIEAVKDFCICNAFKYLYRHDNKNGLEDIKKAQWYINKYLELSGGEND